MERKIKRNKVWTQLYVADDAAEVGDFNGRAAVVGQDIQIYVAAAGGLAEGLLDDAHVSFLHIIHNRALCP
jgi:hypothetical protein